ncbi:MAG: deaminase [Candidatus Binatia bacterium]
MCTGAIIQARMRRLIFGCVDPKAGAVESLYRLCEDRRLNHQLPVVGGVLAQASSVLLADFFARLRQQKREDRKAERWPSPVEGA